MGLILIRVIGSCQSIIGGLVGFPDQVLQRRIVFVVLLLIPDLESIGVKERIVICDTFVIGENTGTVIGTEKREGDRVVHAINVAD